MNLTKEHKRLVLIVAACLAAGYVLAGANMRPQTPAERRPVLAAVIRMAKNLLWLAAFADPPPDHPGPRRVQHIHHVDASGVVMVNHGEGW